MNINEFDERQLLLRGNVFKHGFIFLIITLFFISFLENYQIMIVEGMWDNILIICIAATICLIEMTVLEVFDLYNAKYRRMLILLGILGCVTLIWHIVEFVLNEYSFLSGQFLSKDGAMTIMSLGWSIVGLVYLIKRHTMKYDE